MRPLVKIHGGKYYVHPWILSHFPQNYENLTYIETCAGAASVLLNKNRSSREILNDADPTLYNIFWSLRNHPQEFIQQIQDIPYCLESFENYQKVSIKLEDITSAVAELVVRRMSRGGLKKAFSWSERKRGGRPGDVNAWETFKTVLPQIVDRLKNVEICNLDCQKLLENYVDDENVLIYCDPPYLHETRTAKSVYDYEMNRDKHISLGKLLNRMKGRILLSGYDSPLYQNLYSGWRCERKVMPNHASQGKNKTLRTECLWINYL